MVTGRRMNACDTQEVDKMDVPNGETWLGTLIGHRKPNCGPVEYLCRAFGTLCVDTVYWHAFISEALASATRGRICVTAASL